VKGEKMELTGGDALSVLRSVLTLRVKELRKERTEISNKIADEFDSLRDALDVEENQRYFYNE
jgi:hypothetical protein